jgi:hypothetical protein
MRADDELNDLHLAAHRAGRARVVLREGDAEALLWEAPRARIVQRSYRAGTRRAELRALLDDAGVPLAWWQRCAGAGAAGWQPRYRVPHQTVWAIDGCAHDLGVEDFIDTLARIAGRDPAAYRASLRSTKSSRSWPQKISPSIT